jgi:hypothetical protein
VSWASKLLRAAAFLALLLAALIFPAILGGADEASDGSPPRLLEWPMLPGETLRQLAQLIYPQDSAMQRRFINAAVRENPATFSNFGADRKFDQETLIWLPDLKQLANLATTSRSPRHFLHPALPAMEPSVAGAQPSPLKISSELEHQSTAAVQPEGAAGGIQLAPADNIRHLNATPAYDAAAMAEIELLMARNQALKAEQEKLDARIAALEAGIRELREAIARDRRRSIRRIVPPSSRPAAAAAPPKPASDSLLSPSPFHIVTALAVILAGGAVIWLRRRSKPAGAVPNILKMPPPTSAQMGADFSARAQQAADDKFRPDDSVIMVDEIDSVVEEAKIFVALGRSERAIAMLEEHISAHPRASVNPWLYLMDFYRSANRREDFTELAKRFHQTFNVMAPQWEASAQSQMMVPHSLEEFPHISSRLTDGWGTLDAQDFLNHLLQDNRGGERQGFSLEVLQEILLLLSTLELRDHMPALKPF